MTRTPSHLSSLMPISGVLARDFLPFKVAGKAAGTVEGSMVGVILPASSDSTRTNSSSSSSPSFRRSAHDLPAWRAKTPVRATLQMRLFDARSKVAIRSEWGIGSRRL